MKSIVMLIGVLASVYFSAPNLRQKIHDEVQKAAHKVLTKKMTPLSSISSGLTSKGQ